MGKRIYLIICALIFVSNVGAQEISREQKIEELRIVAPQIEQTQVKLNELKNRRETIAEEILAVNVQDRAEADKIGANTARLFPSGLLKNIMSGSSDNSDYSFMQLSGSYPFPEIEYKNNSLQFKNSEESFGFITNIGGTLLETINEQNKEFIALAKYELSEKFNSIENEYSNEGITFRHKIQIVVGNSYLIRAFNQWGNDGIFAVKVHRKDSDGSIVLFVKLIKDFSRVGKNKLEEVFDNSTQENPQIPPPPVADYAAQQAVTNALYQKGFYNVTVEATTTEITIRGTIPKGKMAEVMQTAQETAKRKVNNQVTEER